MGRIEQGFVAGALVAGVFASGCSSPENLDHAYDQGFVPAASAEVANFWQTQGIDTGSVKVVLLSGPDTANCGTEEIKSDTDEAFFCDDQVNDRIILPAKVINDRREAFGQESRGAILGLIGHEYGHVVINRKPSLMDNAPSDPEARGQYEELMATCLAGIAIHARPNHASETTGAYNSFMRTGDKDHYGGGPAQAAAYSHGYEQATTDPTACLNVPVPQQ